jgi:DNA-binding SARP family transcriptional activator/predicted ATPase
MAQTQISLLGTFQIEAGGQARTSFDSAKVRALLAYLVTESDRAHTRESLAALLWPDQTDRAARHSLSQALSNLRRVLDDQTADPPYLLPTRDTIQWNRDADYTLDVQAFDQRRRAVNHHHHPAPESCAFCLGQMQQAVALYRGAFLDGLTLDDAEGFEEWAMLRRAQLERDMLNLLHRLAQLYEARGEYEPARRAARQQIALDRLHEPAYQQLMRAYAWDGRRAAALRQYRELTQVLSDELATHPAEESTRLFEAIRDRALAPPDHKAATSPAAAPEGPPESRPAFVARERELAYLERLVSTAAGGSGRLVFITGETGSGKSSLLQEIAWRAQDAHPDLAVIAGTGNAHTGLGDPYLPFREMFSQLAGDTSPQSGETLSRRQAQRLQGLAPYTAQALLSAGRDLVDTFIPGQMLLDRVLAESRMTADSWAAGQGSWLPQLEELVGRRAAARDTTSVDQSRLFEQVAAVLQQVAAQRPLLLILDDFQWADAGSASLLFHLGRNLKHSRLTIVCAYRAEDVALGRGDERHPLEPVVNEFKRAYGDIVLNLDAVSETESRAFVEAFIDSQPNRLGPAFRDALFRQTDGHPLFIVELLRDMIARGDLVHDADGRWVEKDGIVWQSLPARAEGAIAERIERLHPELREALAIAAVEGNTFTAEVIAQVQSASERDIVRRLSHELNKQHYLVKPVGTQRINGRRLSLYRFRHSLFQQYLYGHLDPAERAYLHEDVGHVLETIYGDQAGLIAVQLARHYQEAGQLLKAVGYLRQAGDAAMRLSAYQEAASLFSQGLELLRHTPNSAERNEHELALQIALGVVHSVTQGFASQQVEHAFGRARALSQQIGAVPQLFPALWGLFYYYLVRAEDRAMCDLADQLMQMAANVTDPVLQPVGHWAKGVTLLYSGELESAHAHLEEMLAYYDPNQSRSAIFRYVTDPGVACHFWSAWALWLRGYPDQALDRSYEALALAQRLNHPFSLAFALFTSATLHQFRGEPRETLARAEATVALANKHGFAFFQGLADVFRGWAMTEMGEAEPGLALMRDGFERSQASGSRIGKPHMLALLGEAHGVIGQPEEGLTLLSEALAAAHDSNERHYEPEILRLRGDLLRQSGADDAQVEAVYCQAIDVARSQQAKAWELRATVSLVQLWRDRGDSAAAEQTLAAAVDWFREGAGSPDLQKAGALLAELRR